MSKNKGVSLYLAIMIMTLTLAIALGLSTLFISQSKNIQETGNSVIAFYAADAGIEKILVVRDNPDEQTLDYYFGNLTNGASYRISVLRGPKKIPGGEGSCTAASLSYCIISTGTYKESNRAIEIDY